MPLEVIILILTVSASVIGILEPIYRLELRRKLLFIRVIRKNQKKLSSFGWTLIMIAIVTCITSAKMQINSAIETKNEKKTTDSLREVVKAFQESTLNLNKENIMLSRNNLNSARSNFEHSTRIKDSLQKKIDTVRKQNYELSKSQLNSFNSTYKKIKQSADTLLAYLAAKDSYPYAFINVDHQGYSRLGVRNTHPYVLPGGTLRFLMGEDEAKIKIIAIRPGTKIYSKTDYNRIAPIHILPSLPPGAAAIDSIIFRPKPGLNTYTISMILGNGVFVEQVVAYYESRKEPEALIRCFRVSTDKTVLLETHSFGWQHGSVDWTKLFKIPVDIKYDRLD